MNFTGKTVSIHCLRGLWAICHVFYAKLLALFVHSDIIVSVQLFCNY